MSFSAKFAENLREARLSKKLTQAELAQIIGVTASAVSQYEMAKRIPSLIKTTHISHVLDISLDDLVPHDMSEIQVDSCQSCIFDLIGEQDV